MRVVVQRSKESSVIIDGKVNGKIDKGFVLLVGFTFGDTKEIVDKMINKIINLRIFSDSDDKLNLSLKDINGEILSISQFTLYAKLNGRRPSFTKALNYDEAKDLYDYFNEKLRNLDINVETGVFGSDMTVNITNDGPVTIIIDSESDF
mgnify:FL=1